jgi:hypothetical protein
MDEEMHRRMRDEMSMSRQKCRLLEIPQMRGEALRAGRLATLRAELLETDAARIGGVDGWRGSRVELAWRAPRCPARESRCASHDAGTHALARSVREPARQFSALNR